MPDSFMRCVCALTFAACMLTACSTPARRDASPAGSATTPSAKYYKDDGPGVDPANLDSIPDAVPRAEPLHRFANRPYNVLGRDYVPATTLSAFRERGIASWYGRKFHGEKTSTGETYDMYAMTAAHPTLPLPSYARVTGVASGRSVIVRVNDRGPFLHGRVIDLSYAAAHRIGIAQRGSGEVIVESIVPGTPLLPPVVTASVAPVAPTSSAAAPPLGGDATLFPRAGTSLDAAAAGVVVTPLATPPAIVNSSTPLPPPAPVPVQATDAGYVVQLGAFANAVNARNFLAHVQNQLAAAQVEPRMRESGGLWRVGVGPYPTREEARQAAERLQAAFGFDATVTQH